MSPKQLKVLHEFGEKNHWIVCVYIFNQKCKCTICHLFSDNKRMVHRSHVFQSSGLLFIPTFQDWKKAVPCPAYCKIDRQTGILHTTGECNYRSYCDCLSVECSRGVMEKLCSTTMDAHLVVKCLCTHTQTSHLLTACWNATGILPSPLSEYSTAKTGVSYYCYYLGHSGVSVGMWSALYALFIYLFNQKFYTVPIFLLWGNGWEKFPEIMLNF